RWAPAYHASELFKRFDWPKWSVIKRILSIGLPIGIAVFAESSIFAVIALLIGSLIQGLGTGAGGAMSRTVMRDRYSGAELNRANSLVSMGVIFSPLLAPVLGGWLTELFNWRAGYWFLFGFGALTTLALLAWFGET
ncbi:MFS transporter, partial [Escherichia coli]